MQRKKLKGENRKRGKAKFCVQKEKRKGYRKE